MPLQSPIYYHLRPDLLSATPGLVLPLYLLPARDWRDVLLMRRLARFPGRGPRPLPSRLCVLTEAYYLVLRDVLEPHVLAREASRERTKRQGGGNV